MKPGRKTLLLGILLIFCCLIRLYSCNAERVEAGYSSQFFPAFARFLRLVFGKWPVSLGDIIYGAAIIYIIYRLWRLVRFVIKTRSFAVFKSRLKKFAFDSAIIFAVIYIVFNLFWGINYNRKGIASQLGLTQEKYSTAELREINCLLIDRINQSKQQWVSNNQPYPGNKLLFEKVAVAYDSVSRKYPYLAYRPASLKSSYWSWFGNYTGFTGYYNPFTGEAQLNTTVPKFLQPYTACHEVAHQLGYAKEMEANFVGYLAAKASPDALFHYSVYLDLFTYANRNLYMNDSISAKLYRRELDTLVKKDIIEWREFNRKHVGRLEPAVRWLYGKYLQSNQQPNGMSSYDEVTGFIIAYYKKFKTI
jgi:hypothetical protein